MCQADCRAFLCRYDRQLLFYQALLYEVYFRSSNVQRYLCLLLHRRKEACYLSCQVKLDVKVCHDDRCYRCRLRPLRSHVPTEDER